MKLDICCCYFALLPSAAWNNPNPIHYKIYEKLGDKHMMYIVRFKNISLAMAVHLEWNNKIK